MSSQRAPKPSGTTTPIKQHHSALTPSNRTPLKSPLSNNKCAHPSNHQQNVSYGQLQIVLENLQNIKQKASSQVKLLNQENLALRDQVSDLKAAIQDLRAKVNEKDREIREAQDHCKQQIRQKDMECREKDMEIRERDRIIESFKKGQDVSIRLGQQYDKLKEKWKWAFKILSGDEQRAQQLVYKIKSQSCTIWQLLQTKTELSSLFDLSKQKVQSLTHQLITSKEQYKHTSQMLEKSLNELNTVTAKMTSLEEKVKEYSQFLVQTKEQQLLLQKQVQQGNTSRQNLETNILDLQHQIQKLKQDINMNQQIHLQKQKQTQYNNLVNHLCDQTQDYSQILQRLQYLQKFRAEHYKNIQKIQHLCKLIDS